MDQAFTQQCQSVTIILLHKSLVSLEKRTLNELFLWLQTHKA